MTGDLASVPPRLGAEVFRIVQEGCTNVLRHAGAVATQLTITSSGDAIEVRIVNAPGVGGTVRPDRDAGNGLRGMSERVQALGGRLEIGLEHGGGFRLLAHLPVHAAP